MVYGPIHQKFVQQYIIFQILSQKSMIEKTMLPSAQKSERWMVSGESKQLQQTQDHSSFDETECQDIIVAKLQNSHE